jgi:biopolymer transport protein ExbD
MLATLRRALSSGGMLRVLLFGTLAFGAFLFWEGTIFIAPVVIVCALAIFLKRLIQNRRDPNPPLPRFAGRGSFNRNPLGYLTIGATVIRLTLLMVFFVMFSNTVMQDTWHYYPGVSVELAKATHPSKKPKAMREDAVIVALERDGKVYVGTEQVGPDDLVTRIVDGLRAGSEQRVYIKADARVRYRLVKDVLDGVRSTRVENVTFLVEQVKPTGPVGEIRNIFRP